MARGEKVGRSRWGRLELGFVVLCEGTCRGYVDCRSAGRGEVILYCDGAWAGEAVVREAMYGASDLLGCRWIDLRTGVYR